MELVNVLYASEEAIAQGAVPKPFLSDVERDLVLLLAPFAPYLAHELWEMIGEKSICSRPLGRSMTQSWLRKKRSRFQCR